MKNIKWKENLKYHSGEKFWICCFEGIEIYIQGAEEKISQKHLLFVERILEDFEAINQSALNRLYQTIPSLKTEKLKMLYIHAFHDKRSVTATPVNFMLTYGYDDDYDTKGEYVVVARYTVKFMESFRPIAVEDWFE